MRLIVAHFVSGQAFFSGSGLVMGGVAFGLWPGRANRWRILGANLLAFLGFVFMAMSGTPLPGWFYAAVGLVLAGWSVACRAAAMSARWQRPSRVLGIALGAAVTAGMAWELPYHRPPQLPTRTYPRLHVIGDSLTAGMGAPEPTWPEILLRRHGVEIADLAVAGATVGGSLERARQILEAEALVLLAIGGNDLLNGTPPAEFERDLAELLQIVCGPGRTVLMLELPLPAFHNRYGAIQRGLARRHGVVLVPKRVLTGVLAAPGATVDGIHLSAAGQERMAAAMWEQLGALLPARIESAAAGGV
jgi:acyl-CoA thioesterase-1